MQQRQTSVFAFVTKTPSAASSSAKTAPIALDTATLKLVAGGAQLSGPHGGWSSAAIVDGPHGGW